MCTQRTYPDSLEVSVMYPCFDSAVYCVLIQASGDPFRLIAGFLSLRFDLINMTRYGCLVRLKCACDLKKQVSHGQPVCSKACLVLISDDSLRKFSRCLKVIYFKTFRGLITFTTCLAYIYFNFMCCACCGLAPILFGIAVGSLHTIF